MEAYFKYGEFKAEGNLKEISVQVLDHANTLGKEERVEVLIAYKNWIDKRKEFFLDSQPDDIQDTEQLKTIQNVCNGLDKISRTLKLMVLRHGGKI